MAKKLPVIIDNRNGNTVLEAFQKLLPNLQKMDIATGVFEGKPKVINLFLAESTYFARG